jgi:uncharacterized membrane protein
LQSTPSNRLHFIDFTRGLVMILMAWDHVTLFWMQIHGGGESPYIYITRNLELSPTLFFSRFITHWCAPTFVFLSGVSLALSVNNRLKRGDTQTEITIHIIKRGIILLIIEALLISPAFDFPRHYFGVLATIGASLIILSLARRLPTPIILGASLITLLNHQFLNLDILSMDIAWSHYLRRILYEPGLTWYPYFSLYPIIPWIAIMGLGWVLGTQLIKMDGTETQKLTVPFLLTGVLAISLFFIVRYLNGYGNLIPRWSNNILDWLYISKYPPSIAFLLWTLGGTCIFMAAGILITNYDWTKKNIIGAVYTFGRVPLFFYITHLWTYKLRLPQVEPPLFLNLAQTFALYIGGLLVLWLLSKRYMELKKSYPRFLQYI